MDIERLISHTGQTTTLPPDPQHRDVASQYPQELFSPASSTTSTTSSVSTISSASTTATTAGMLLQNQQGGSPIHHHHQNQKLPSLYPLALAPQDAQITNGTIPRTSSPSHHDQHHHTHVHHSTQTPNRRLAHILSEQKRRENINSGFEELKSIVPSCRGCADSKAVILRKAVHYIQNLESEIQKLKHNSIPSTSTPSPSSNTPSPSPIIYNKQLPANGNNNGNSGNNNLSANGFTGPLPPITMSRAGVGGSNGSGAAFALAENHQPYQFEKQQFNDQWRPINNTPDQPVAYMPNGNETNHHAPLDAPQTTNRHSGEYRFRQNPINSSMINKFHSDNNYSPPLVANVNNDDERHFKNEEMDWRLAKPNLYNEMPLQQQQQPQQPPPPPQQQLYIEHRPCCRNHNPPPSSSLERILVKQEEITGEIRTMVANRVRM